MVCSIHAAPKSPVGNLRRAIPGCVYRCRSSCAIGGRPQRWGGIRAPDPVIVANFEDSIAHCSEVYISTVLTYYNASPIFGKLGYVGSTALRVALAGGENAAIRSVVLAKQSAHFGISVDRHDHARRISASRILAIRAIVKY